MKFIFTSFSKQFKQLKLLFCSLGDFVFPKGRVEWFLLLFFFCLYGVAGTVLALNSNLLDSPEGVGSYLGYDNLYHFRTNGGAFDISHPFFVVFYISKYLISSFLAFLFGAKAKILFCVLLMDGLISSALLVLYKYLRHITGLSLFRGLLLTFFCAFFFTTIVLSFTVESYPFSFFFLLLSLLFLSTEYKSSGYFKRGTVLFFEFLCGGVTITNGAKPLTAFFLNGGGFREKVRCFLSVVIPFVVCTGFVFCFYFLKSSLFEKEDLVKSVVHLSDYFFFDSAFMEDLFVDFFSSSVLATPLTLQSIGEEVVLRPSFYDSLFPYFLMCSLALLLFVSFFLNRKEPLVILILGYLSIDVFVHCIFRYGMNEGIIFGGNWIYIIPIMLAWLYRYFLKNRLRLPLLVLDFYLIPFTFLLLFHNGRILINSFFLFS